MDPLKNLECILLQCSLSGHQDPAMRNKTLQVCNQTNTSGKSETDTTTSNCWQYWNNKCLQVRAILIIFVTAKKVLLSQVSILTGQNIGKEVNLSLCNFQFMNMIVCYKETNLRFTVEDLVVCSRMGVGVTCQYDRRVNFLAGQVAIQAEHCPMTGHYFEHCKYSTSSQQ